MEPRALIEALARVDATRGPALAAMRRADALELRGEARYALLDASPAIQAHRAAVDRAEELWKAGQPR
jgi:hypothetical protein